MENGRELAVNPEPDERGGLRVVDGVLVKVEGDTVGVERFRSHLLDCKALAKTMYKNRVITLGKLESMTPIERGEYVAKRVLGESCDKPDCTIEGKHVHCFKCGEAGHYADACETEVEGLKELVFG